MTAIFPEPDNRPRWNMYTLRQGRKVGRTLYLTPITNPDGDGLLIGMVDDITIAKELVRLWDEAHG